VLLDSEGKYWPADRDRGTLPGGTPLVMTYLPVEGGRHHLSIKSNDAGAALRVLDLFDDVQGGKLDVFGDAVDSEPQRPLKGKARSQDFRLINQSGLVRLISLTGFIRRDDRRRLPVRSFIAEFTKTGAVWMCPWRGPMVPRSA